MFNNPVPSPLSASRPQANAVQLLSRTLYAKYHKMTSDFQDQATQLFSTKDALRVSQETLFDTKEALRIMTEAKEVGGRSVLGMGRERKTVKAIRPEPWITWTLPWAGRNSSGGSTKDALRVSQETLFDSKEALRITTGRRRLGGTFLVCAWGRKTSRWEAAQGARWGCCRRRCLTPSRPFGSLYHHWDERREEGRSVVGKVEQGAHWG